MNTQGHLSIPKPCHENWLNMSVEEKGRHCAVCCKTVLDFTGMPTEKAISIIAGKSSEKICGRFRPDQLSHPATENKSRNRYRIFMAALYFVFGGLLFTSCRPQKDDVKMGKVKIENSFMPAPENNLDTPSSRVKNKTCTNNTNTGAKHKVEVDTLEPEIHMLGEVIYMPVDTMKK